MDLKTVLRAQWDRATAIAATALGGLLLLIGWLGVSDTPFLAEQAPYILSGGVGGVFLLGVGATLWISADLRDEWRKLDRIESALQDGTLRFVDDEDDAVDLPAQRGAVRGQDAEPSFETTSPRHAAARQDVEVLEAPVRKAARRTTATRTADLPVAGTTKRGRAGVGHA